MLVVPDTLALDQRLQTTATQVLVALTRMIPASSWHPEAL